MTIYDLINLIIVHKISGQSSIDIVNALSFLFPFDANFLLKNTAKCAINEFTGNT